MDLILADGTRISARSDEALDVRVGDGGKHQALHLGRARTATPIEIKALIESGKIVRIVRKSKAGTDIYRVITEVQS